ncbi:MAG: tRNA (adenosine(37)-N6)-threonylcarbamoyltransferase complex ATPase subunit type 1 TsaE [Deltaproteobacteria bacterium]|nr:tRNA (adenosine(37)-N6)-threonylcarbamoyltransferase complex ATPase subunit type 1 TsaE [Deltaproteobacteria bacterium]
MNGDSVTCRTSSGEETVCLGRRLGAHLQEGDVIALAGDLGSGKTWFTKGLALGLGVSPDQVVTSPTFALMNAYEGRCMLFHMDVYRLETAADFLNAGLDEYLHGNGVSVMEWADRWPEILPERHLKVRIKILDEHSREITLSGHHPEAVSILRAVKKEVR